VDIQLAGGPRYGNDCSECTFLGQCGEYDLYFCTQSGVGIPTVIARFGEGGDYLSGMNSDIPVLKTAKRLARERGLL